jgi:hypothetical protein
VTRVRSLQRTQTCTAKQLNTQHGHWPQFNGHLSPRPPLRLNLALMISSKRRYPYHTPTSSYPNKQPHCCVVVHARHLEQRKEKKPSHILRHLKQKATPLRVTKVQRSRHGLDTDGQEKKNPLDPSWKAAGPYLSLCCCCEPAHKNICTWRMLLTPASSSSDALLCCRNGTLNHYRGPKS